MSDADLTVSGSIHQADRHLSDVSRVRQCAFTAKRANSAVFRNGCPIKSMRY